MPVVSLNHVQLIGHLGASPDDPRGHYTLTLWDGQALVAVPLLCPTEPLIRQCDAYSYGQRVMVIGMVGTTSQAAGSSSAAALAIIAETITPIWG